MQIPPRSNACCDKTTSMQNSHKPRRLGGASLSLALALALCSTLVRCSHAWQFDAQALTHQTIFPTRHANIASDFYQQPAAAQFLYNQPLNSLAPQQQYLTQASSAAQPAAPAASGPSAPVANAFDAVLAPASGIAQQEVGDAPPQSPLAEALSSSGRHEQPINVRDVSQQLQPQLHVGPIAKSSDAPALVAPQRQDEQQQARAPPTSPQQQKQDHDIVASPSPLGKILDVVVRETASALSNISHANKQSTTTTTTQDAKQSPAAAEPSSTSARATETSGAQATATSSDNKRPSQQLLRPATTKTKSSEKKSLNSIEQQIINQHARAASHAPLNGRKHEQQQHEQQQQQQTTTSTQQQEKPQQLLRLPPIKHRSETKLFSSFLSALNHNSGAPASGTDSSSSSSSGANDRQPSSLFSALLDNFKSGVTSRSSIVKAAISDNKLARTLTTVGKTIGGNKYVAGAGAAAALAALGLTVSKFISPYVLAGSYSKLGAGGGGGASGYEPILMSGSLAQPTYVPTYEQDRNAYFPPRASQFQNPGDSMVAAAATNEEQLGQFSPESMAAAAAAVVANSQQVDNAGDGATYSAPGAAQLYHYLRPKTKESFVSDANGHYTNFYASQGQYDPAPGINLGTPTFQGSYEPSAAQQGTYVAGSPVQGGLVPESGPYNGDEMQGYSQAALRPLQGDTTGILSSYQDQQGYSNYELPASGGGTTSGQFDQIASSASNETPAYVGAKQLEQRFSQQQQSQQPQPALRQHFVNYARVPGATSGQAVAPGAAGEPHRSGAVMLKLDEATRNLIRQQLKVELAGAPSHLNYELLSSRASPRQPPQQRHTRSEHQSSGGGGGGGDGVLSFPEQRAQQISFAADSSGDYPTFAEWPHGGPVRTIKASPIVGGAEAANYAPASAGAAQPQFVIEAAREQWRHANRMQQAAHTSANEINSNAPGQQQLAYNSIRPQMQTSRNEVATNGGGGGSGGKQSAAASTQAFIRAETLAQQPQHQAPAEHPSAGKQQKHSQELGHVARRDLPLAQPQQVAQVPSSAPLSGDRHPEAAASSGRVKWNAVGGQQQRFAGDKKLPDASSLDSPSGFSAESFASTSHDLPSSESNAEVASASSPHLHAASRNAARASSTRPAVGARTTTASGADNSWQIPSALDQQSLIRDYEILAAQQQHQSSVKPGPERPTDGATPPAGGPKNNANANKAHNGEEMRADSGAESQDELLQVASNMRANLIQLTTSTGQASGAGGKYRLDSEAENNAAGVNLSSSFDDKKESERNKLIEARANTSSTDGGRGSGTLSSAAAPSPAQHDQHHHNQRHRSHKQQSGKSQSATITTTSAGDNAVLELAADENAAGSQQRQETTTTTGADQAANTPAAHKQVGEAKSGHQHRAFHGIVAGGLGGAN